MLVESRQQAPPWGAACVVVPWFVHRCIASRNYRRYDGAASSGSVVANDPVNHNDPSGKQCEPRANGRQACTIVPEVKNPTVGQAIVIGAVTVGAAIWNTGVRIYEKMTSNDRATSPATSESTDRSQRQEPTTVYRLSGGISGPLGHSWTTVDPRTMSNPRDSLGLPNGNTATTLSTRQLVDTEGVARRAALPLDGNQGGAPELLVPNPAGQIHGITREEFREPQNNCGSSGRPCN